MHSDKIRTHLLAGVLVTNLGAGVGLAADVTMVEASQSWLDPSVWSDNAAPSVSNDYFTDTVGNGILRTSPAGATAGGDADFTGNSVTVVGGTRFLIKQEDGETASINGGSGDLIVDGGRASFAPDGGPHSATLDVDEFQVTATAGAFIDVAASADVCTVAGTLTGSGDLLINYEGGTDAAGRVVSFMDVADYIGTLTVSEGMRLDFGSDVDFAGGLELTDTAILNVDQNLSFEADKLIGSNGFVPGGVYTGAEITNLGPNFTDGGGTLVVGDTTTDSDEDGLPDEFERRLIDADPADEVTDLSDVAGPGDLPAVTDFDDDGSSDAEEYARGTDPLDSDSDDDGLSDSVETGTGTFVDAGDTGTDPLNADSDYDGFGDGIEIAGDYDPHDASSAPARAAGNPRSVPQLATTAGDGAFPIHADGSAATIVHDAGDAEVVKIAADLLAADVEAVGGTRPEVTTSASGIDGPAILVGTVGESPLIDGLAASGKLDVSGILGNWESYHLARVADPLPGIGDALVVAGSDRRGTAYGLGAISEAMGVSPWTWWADVAPPSFPEVHLAGLPLDSSPPSVRYRGIFINDEDWGLQEWAEKTYESGPGEVNDMGPKTYARVFELMLRLRANLCWPAMHPSTRAFHYYPQNKQVADDYAIVMGSSHAEPMLRNNVDEWDRFINDNGYSDNWDYEDNKPVIYEYWDTRARQAAPFENFYTVGKRGIHDSGMVEGSGTTEKAGWLNTIFDDQREIIANRVDPDPTRVPQVFVPYKEVLDIYDSGLVDVPDDVTLVWPDDNHGYIRRLSNAEEQQRPGGGGVYYHLSYWGAPRDYLWLSSIPPSLIWEEMTKAYQNRCRRMWIFNVGDIKPAEVSLEFSLRLAWNVHSYGPGAQKEWLREWAAREFGPERAGAIASLMNDYYRLNHRRKPEHMDWGNRDPGSTAPPEGSRYPLFSQVHEGDETADRLGEFELLKQRADAIYDELPASDRDAFYQLAVYPVRGSAAMNRKFLHTARGHRALAQKRKTVGRHAGEAGAAYDAIPAETETYNNELAGGKWNEMMDWRPRGLDVFDLPDQAPDAGAQSVGLGVAVEGRLEPVFTDPDGAGDTGVELHAVDDAALTAPMQETTLDGRRCVWTPGSGGIAGAGEGGRASYTFNVPESGTYAIKFEVRTPTPDDDSWWIELDGATPEVWNDLGIGNPAGWRWRVWKTVPLSAGSHSLVVHEREDGAAIAAIRVSDISAAGELGEDRRFSGFRLPEFNSMTRRAFFLDLINTDVAPLSWNATTDDPWVSLSSNSGTLEDERRLWVSIDWDALPADEHLDSMIRLQHGGDTVEVPVHVWNPAVPPAADFIEENGAVVMEAEHPTTVGAGAGASWVEVSDLGAGEGSMAVQPANVPSLTTPAGILAEAPVLEYSFHLRSGGSHRIEASFLPALSLNDERGRRYAVAVDGEEPTIVSLSPESGSGSEWSRSVLRSVIKGDSTHSIEEPGVHTLRIWMVDPGLVLDRVSVLTGTAPYTHNGLRETSVSGSGTLMVSADETVVLDAGSTRYRRVVNHGTIELRSSDVEIEGDLINFGTLRVSGESGLDVEGNLANFGVLDSLSWTGEGFPDVPDVSDFGSSLDTSAFRIDSHWIDGAGIHIRVPGYAGHWYALERAPSLAPDSWMPVGSAKAGSGTPGAPEDLIFDWPADEDHMFFRIVLDGGVEP